MDKDIKPYFQGLGLKRLPQLIFDNRYHRFSKWGLSLSGQYSYRLNPQAQNGEIRQPNKPPIRFSWAKVGA